jgi:type VI secretion system secreted protein VgrG
VITSTKLLVEIGDDLTHGCMSFELSQNMHGHHFFRAKFSGESLENNPQGLGDDSLKHIGQVLKIELSNNANESSNFKGIITSVRAIGSNQSGQGQIIIFEGYSPTILLENGPTSHAFTNMSLSDIINKACQGPEANLLKLSVKPQNNSKLPYIVQYNENAFEFVNRIARRYGEWLYYNGSEMVVGEKGASQIDLIYGSDLQNFDYVMQSASVIRQFTAHTFKTNQTQDINTNSINPGTKGTGKQVYDAAAGTWQAPQGPILFHFDEVDSIKKHLDDVAKITAEAAAANCIIFNGSSMNPSLYPGANIKISGVDKHEYGQYIIIAVNHNYSIGGNYQNSFSAIPSDVKVSPYTNPGLMPRCDPQSGTVDDNNDPDGMGRVKVRLYWQKDSVTPWIRIAMPYTGNDKGTFFVPEKGEEVMVGFEGGNAEMPFVMGGLYHGKALPSSFINDKNDIKAIKTRSGNMVEFKDTDGEESITITDKKGNVIKIDSKEDEITISALKKITISASEEIKLSSKNIKIDALENLSIGANKNISQSAGEKYNIMAKDIEEHAENKKISTSKKSESTSEEVIINSTDKNLTLASGKSVDVQSNEKVKLF